MDEYIKRKDAIDICTECVDFQDSIENINASAEAMRIRRLIKELPSADVVERKRGKWNCIQGGMSVCPYCGASPHDYFKNYCPNCGAKMDGGAE